MDIKYHIDAYSHGIRVYGYNHIGYQNLKEFCRTRLTQFGLVPVGYNRFERKPMKVYAATNKERTEYRFHRNQLDDLKQFLIGACFVKNEEIVVNYIAAPKGAAVDFKMVPTIKMRDYQEPIVDYAVDDDCSTKAIILQTGRGKALPIDALVKIPGGWKRIGDMQLGDVITAKDGTPTTVTGVFPQGTKEIFKITFEDGRTAECCEDHLWKVYRPNRSWDSKVVDTKEMIRLKSLSNNRLYIDLIDPEQGADIELPLDPYVLGVILGNGCIQPHCVSITSSDPHTVETFEYLLPYPVKLKKTTEYTYLLNCHGMKNNLVLDALRQLGLDDKRSYEKFIPNVYLNASTQQRLALLQGLMDTDGTATTDGSPSYSTSSPQFAKDVQYLVRSLGGHAYMRYKTPHYTHKGEYLQGRDSFVIGIRIKNPRDIFRLPRKRERVDYDNQYSATLKLGVDSIESSGTFKEAVCISIDHPEKLFVTNDFVVTHNSKITLKSVERISERAILFIRPMYIKRWLDELNESTLCKKGDILVVKGMKDLRNLILLGKGGELNAKFIIISNKTYLFFLQAYEEFGDVTELYGCNPQDFFEVIEGGVRLIDEVHLDYHFNFRLDCYTNIKKVISMTATFESGNNFTNKMYELGYPVAGRYAGAEYIRYIVAKALLYTIDDPSTVRFMNRMKFYNHVEFEKSLMRKENKMMLERYIKMIIDIVYELYARDAVPGQKMIVFCATIKLCTLIQERIKSYFKEFCVGRYVEDDPYENLMVHDITVSTLLSAGTAVDIPGLRATLMTTAVDSRQSNEQALGRLRVLEKWPDIDPVFAYLVAENNEKHVQYHNNKMLAFAGKVKSHQVLSLGVRI